MFADIVFPEKNEEEFILTAERLGYSAICFAYELGDVEKIRKRISELAGKSKLNVYLCFAVKPKDCAKARNYCEFVLVKSSGNDQDVLEKNDFDVLLDAELSQSRDAMHYRMSGLNQVLCKIAADKKRIIGINLRNILDYNSEDRQMIIGRIMQNVMLCRKFKAKMIIFSGARKPMQMKGHNDLISLMNVFGLNPNEAKAVLGNTPERIKENIKKKSPEYIKEGVELIK